jgi:hypothetical protein
MADDFLEPARQGPQDRRRLLQRALACELTGKDCALALIRRLRVRADPSAAPRRSDRRRPTIAKPC